MKRFLSLILVLVVLLSFTACESSKLGNAPIPSPTPQITSLTPINGNTLEKEHTIEGFKFITNYNTGNYDLNTWKVTDSKALNIEAFVKDVPEGATVLVEHVHADVSLKSDNSQFNGLIQDSMDDSFHGNTQDGFYVSETYPYQNTFTIEGFSKDLIDGWMFVCGDFGDGQVFSRRLTEENLVEEGNVTANKLQIVYDILVKYDNEEFYHVVSILDEFLIPITIN